MLLYLKQLIFATFHVAFVKARENYLSRKLKIPKLFSWKVIYPHWSNSIQIQNEFLQV